MKSKVHFSTYCTIITIVVPAALLTGILTHLHSIDQPTLLTMALTVAIVAAGLYYCPVSVSVNPSELIIHRLLSGDKTFPLPTSWRSTHVIPRPQVSDSAEAADFSATGDISATSS